LFQPAESSHWLMLRRSIPPVTNESPKKTVWEIALEILGVTAGLAAVAYFVGAVTIWLRLSAAHYSADIGLELMSDGRIIAVGVRAIALVAAIIGLALLLTNIYAKYWAKPIRDLAKGRRKWLLSIGIPMLIVAIVGVTALISVRIAGVAVSALFIAAVAVLLGSGARRKRTWWAVGIAAGLAVVVSGFHGWRLFALVLATIAVVALATLVIGEREGRVPWWVNVSIVVCVLVAAIGWQINTPIKFAQVYIDPPLGNAPAEQGRPFFGSTDSFIYVAEVNVETDPDAEHDFRASHAITEIPRDSLTSVAFGGAWYADPEIRSPAQLVADWAERMWEDITD
jgi:MFS family permease